MPTTRSPDLAEALRLWYAKALRDVRVSLPCQVAAYDAGAQTVDVKPQVQDFYTDDNGAVQFESLPTIPSVPIEWPSGGGMRITFPLKVGDSGRVTFCDRSIDAWLGLASPADTAPSDGRRHALQDAVFTPGLRVGGQAWQRVSGTVTQIGADGSSADAVATAQRVLSQLQNIVDAFNNHTHDVTWTGSPGTGPSTAPLATMPDPSAPASDTVEILG